MSRIFLSHSSSDNASATALRDWLVSEGWPDVFLDLDPASGIAPGERWERALSEAANRCEAVIFLISRAWLSSDWCRRELMLALRLSKRIFGVAIEELPIESLPPELTASWQVVQLGSGADHRLFRARLPDGSEAHVTFSALGLQALKTGLTKAGLDPRFFAWPPENDPERAPWRGMAPLEAEDAGIFFGRDAPLIEVLDRLRGMAEGAPPRFLTLLAASGAGKSSFLRAGLLPRLARDDLHFLPLPPFRPERAVLSGEAEGLVSVIERAARNLDLALSRAEISAAADQGAEALGALLAGLVDARPPPPGHAPPVLVLALDQAEELFNAAGRAEAERFLTLLKDLLALERPQILCIATIRSDAYERLQTAPELEGLRQQTFSLPPIPRGQWASVIEGPAARAVAAGRKLRLDPALTAALLADSEAGGGRDALPLLAFTLGRLYRDHAGKGALTLEDYRQTGGMAGAVNAAVERAFARAESDPSVPVAREARLALLRRGLIPWLAGIDPDTGAARRVSARLSDIPAEARPLIELLVSERLLSREQAWSRDEGGRLIPAGEPVIEPVHEALLRQWGALRGWLEEDFGKLAGLESLRRAARDWHANGGDPAWLSHRAGRLEDAERLSERPDLWARLDAVDHDYLARCRQAENAEREAREAQLKAIAAAERAKRKWAMAGGGIAAALALAAGLAGAYGLHQAGVAQEQTAAAERNAELADLSARSAREQTARAEAMAADLAHDAARELASQGRVDAALQTLIEVTPETGDQHASVELIEAFRPALARALSEERFLVPATVLPFEMGKLLYLQDPLSGQVLQVDGSGAPKPVFSLPGQVITAVDGAMTDTALIAVYTEDSVSFFRKQTGADSIGQPPGLLFTVARPEEQRLELESQTEFASFYEDQFVAYPPPRVEISPAGMALITWEIETFWSGPDQVVVDLNRATSELLPADSRALALNHRFPVDQSASTTPVAMPEPVLWQNEDWPSVELLSEICVAPLISQDGAELLKSALVAGELPAGDDWSFHMPRCRMSEELALIEVFRLNGSRFDRSTSLYRLWRIEDLAQGTSGVWQSPFDSSPDTFSTPYRGLAEAMPEDGPTASLFTGPPGDDAELLRQPFTLADPDGDKVTFAWHTAAYDEGDDRYFEDIRRFPARVRHVTMLSLTKAAVLLEGEAESELVLVTIGTVALPWLEPLPFAGGETASDRTGAIAREFCLPSAARAAEAALAETEGYRLTREGGMLIADAGDPQHPHRITLPLEELNPDNDICGMTSLVGGQTLITQTYDRETHYSTHQELYNPDYYDDLASQLQYYEPVYRATLYAEDGENLTYFEAGNYRQPCSATLHHGLLTGGGSAAGILSACSGKVGFQIAAPGSYIELAAFDTRLSEPVSAEADLTGGLLGIAVSYQHWQHELQILDVQSSERWPPIPISPNGAVYAHEKGGFVYWPPDEPADHRMRVAPVTPADLIAAARAARSPHCEAAPDAPSCMR